MNVIHGQENLELIDDRYTVLELETLFVKEGMEPVPHYAVVGPDDLGLDGMLKIKQMIPVHEALMKNYKQQNWDFCLQAINKLNGNIDPFMDSFYEILQSRIEKQQETPAENWTHILDVS